MTLKPFVAYPDFAPGFNANGIVAAGPDALIYVQSNLVVSSGST